MRRSTLIALAAVLACGVLPIGVGAQTLQAPFAGQYSVTDLGSVPGLPTNYGGLVVDRSDTDRLLIGGAANGATGKLYAIGLVRDPDGHVSGFDGTAAVYADAANNDGGVVYGPTDVLFLARYPLNQIGQTRPGSTATDKIVDLGPLGVDSSPGGLAFIPDGFPGAGRLKLGTYPTSTWYTLTYSPDGAGTFDITAATSEIALSGGIEGIAFVPPGSPEFVDNRAVLISEYSAGKVSTYELDDDGNPDAATRRDFLTGLNGAEGATIDPVTGDFLFSTFGGGSRVIAVRGFVAPGATPTPTVTPSPCGNGVVDTALGEDCDVAIAGSDCCTASCRFAAAGVVCRAVEGECDVTETCSGDAAACPPDVRRHRRATGRAASPRATVLEAATAHLASTPLQKAAVKCQSVIAKARAKVVTGKFKALDACANAAVTCVQRAGAGADCLAKAGGTCIKKLTAAAATLRVAREKIETAKSCATELRLPDLLAADGLGLGEIAEQCRADFALDVCGGLPSLAECLVRTEEQKVGLLYGRGRPRTAEVLGLLPSTLPAIPGLETFAGCGKCGSTGDGKAVDQCGQALTHAIGGLLAALDKRFGACAERVFACTQGQPTKPQCLVAARAKCDAAVAAVTTTLEKFTGQIAKRCGTSAVDFPQLANTSGLALEALGPECAAFGLAPPSSLATLSDCLQQRARCTAAEVVRESIARTAGFAGADRLGALGPALVAACPEIAPTSPAAPQVPRVSFGSMGKYMKGVRHVGVSGITRPGSPPSPTGTGSRGVTIPIGSQRIWGASLLKMPFSYRVAARTRATHAAVGSDTALLVAVLAAGATTADYVEVPLDPPPGQTEVHDEIELEYTDAVSGCFTLAFAIADGGVVSDYTLLPVVVDPELDPCQ